MELNDVIKALECCAAPVTRCDECPVDKAKKDDCVCGVYVAGEALKVIRELTEENERVIAQNEVLEIKNKDFKYRIYELSRDNEEWEHENKDLECDNDMLRELIRTYFANGRCNRPNRKRDVGGREVKACRSEKERLSYEKEIIFINKIICESVIHGADRGGSYDSNENNLTEAINEWLKYKKLDHLFCVKLRDVRKDFGYRLETWNIPQICEKLQVIT